MKQSEFKTRYNNAAEKAWKEFSERKLPEWDGSIGEFDYKAASAIVFQHSKDFTDLFVAKILEEFLGVEPD